MEDRGYDYWRPSTSVTIKVRGVLDLEEQKKGRNDKNMAMIKKFLFEKVDNLTSSRESEMITGLPVLIKDQYEELKIAKQKNQFATISTQLGQWSTIKNAVDSLSSSSVA